MFGHFRCSAKPFANETSLFSVVRNLNETATKLNGDLKNMSKWAHQWKISFNSDATKMEKEIFKSKNQNLFILISLFTDKNVLYSQFKKHLGLDLQSQTKLFCQSRF